MKKAKKISETDLLKPLVEWLKTDGWEVYQEVLCPQGTADIVATKPYNKTKLVWVIEGKTSLSSAVMEQAARWVNIAHFVSIAVPARRGNKSNFFYNICKKHLGIGAIYIGHKAVESGSAFGHMYYSSRSLISTDSPQFNRRAKVGKIIKNLNDRQKSSIAGSQAGEALTPFKITMLNVKDLLKEKGPTPLKTIIESCRHHYSNDKTARCQIAKAMREWMVDDFEYDQIEKTYKLKDKNGTSSK